MWSQNYYTPVCLGIYTFSENVAAHWRTASSDQIRASVLMEGCQRIFKVGDSASRGIISY